MGVNMLKQPYKIYLDSGCPSGDGYSCLIFIVKYLLEEKDTVEKVVLLNALVPVSDKPAIVISIPTTAENVRELIKRAKVIESYVGHEATAKLLTQLFRVEIPVSRAMYVPQNRDLAIIVRLKKRLEKPEDVKNVTVNDIELLLVRYYTDVDIVVRDW
jgi:hypothetical protein